MIFKAKVVKFDINGLSVVLEDGRFLTNIKMAFPYRRGGSRTFNPISGIFVHPHEGDNVLVVQVRGEFIALPAFYAPSLLAYSKEETLLQPVDLKYIFEEVQSLPGDIVIFGAEGNYIRLTSSGYIMFVTNINRTIYYSHSDGDVIFGRIHTIFSNLLTQHYTLTAGFEWRFDSTAGHRITFDLSDDYPLPKGNIIQINITRFGQNYLTVTVDKRGNLEISSVAFKLTSNPAGIVSIEANSVVNIKANATVNVIAKEVKLGSDTAMGNIVTGYPYGTMPYCYVTGSPILGSQTCKATP